MCCIIIYAIHDRDDRFEATLKRAANVVSALSIIEGNFVKICLRSQIRSIQLLAIPLFYGETQMFLPPILPSLLHDPAYAVKHSYKKVLTFKKSVGDR